MANSHAASVHEKRPAWHKAHTGRDMLMMMLLYFNHLETEIACGGLYVDILAHLLFEKRSAQRAFV